MLVASRTRVGTMMERTGTIFKVRCHNRAVDFFEVCCRSLCGGAGVFVVRMVRAGPSTLRAAGSASFLSGLRRRVSDGLRRPTMLFRVALGIKAFQVVFARQNHDASAIPCGLAC